MKVVTREEMQEIDRITINEYGIPGIVLMEMAGIGIANLILVELKNKGYLNPKIYILTGAGNNGGDSLVVARHLYNRNIFVKIFLFGEIEKILTSGKDISKNLNIISKMKIPLIEVRENIFGVSIPAIINELKEEADIIVDGLFGTGLTRELSKNYCDFISKLNALNKFVIAIDIPSGLDANTGLPLGEALKATITATLALPKAGFYKNKGPEYTGRIEVIDIGIPRNLNLN